MAKKRAKKKTAAPAAVSSKSSESSASGASGSPPTARHGRIDATPGEPAPWDDGRIPGWIRRPWAQWVQRALWVVVALSVPAFFYAWDRSFPLDEAVEVKVKLVLSIAVTALVSLRYFQPASRVPTRKAGPLLVLAGLIAIVAYYNFGAFHGRVFVHYWEQFHYSINAKYFPELGHDGLYVASLQAQSETYPQERLQPVVRDLRTNEMVQTYSASVEAHRREVKARFSPERWQTFVDDHQHFLDINSRGYLYQIRRDHGFNPPPTWTFVARIFARFMPLDSDGLGFLGFLDVALLATLFVFVFRTYGSRVGALALVVFGLNYAGRYYWVGGAFLREDWLAAVGIGICLLEKERYRWAGACFAYAALVRLFPVLFLVGPGIVALRSLRQGRWRWVRDLAIGFVAVVVVGVGLGTLAGRGPTAWPEFADTISLHRQTWLTNNVGLENLWLYEKQDFDRVLVDFSQPEPWARWQDRMDQRKEDLHLPVRASQAALLLLLAVASWRARPAEAAVWSLVCVFALVLSTCYYWQALLFLVFLRKSRILYAVLALNLAMCVLHFVTPAFEMRYGLFSWGLLLLFLLVLVPPAWSTLRARTVPATANG